MLKEIFGDLSDMLGDFMPGPKTRTITVAKPCCAPARPIITSALLPYGVKIHKLTEGAMLVTPKKWLRQQGLRVDNQTEAFERPAPFASIAKLVVNEKAAAWVEYLLLRTGKLYVPGGYVNERNADWAARHGGKMPPAWKDGKPWIEKSCSESIKAWEPVKKVLKEARQNA